MLSKKHLGYHSHDPRLFWRETYKIRNKEKAMRKQAVLATDDLSRIESSPLSRGMTLIRTLEGMCGHSDRWSTLKTFLTDVFNRNDLNSIPIQKSAISKARSDVMDALEAAFARDPAWPLIRNRALNTFGTSGLERFT